MAKKKKSFEEKLENIDEIIELFENGEISLDESIKKYEEAMELIGNCHKELEEAKGKIEKVIETNNGIEFEKFE